MDMVEPAKKVDSARAVCPAFKPKMAEAVHATMIIMMKTINSFLGICLWFRAYKLCGIHASS